MMTKQRIERLERQSEGSGSGGRKVFLSVTPTVSEEMARAEYERKHGAILATDIVHISICSFDCVI